MVRLSCLAVALSVIGLATGCDQLTVDEFAGDYPRAICERETRCGLWSDVDRCIALAHLDFVDLTGAVHAGSVSFDADAAATCLDDVAAMSCELAARATRVPLSSCVQAAHGDRVVGDTCVIGAECASQVCAVGGCAASCCQGTCAARAAIGESCAATQCDADAFCDPSTSRCAPLLAADSACAQDAQCDYGLRCLSTATAGMACRVPLALGQTGGPFGCAELGGVMDPLTSTCISRVGGDQPCNALVDNCQRGWFCDHAASQPVCHEAPGPGGNCAACDQVGGWCDVDTCRALGETDAPCTDNIQCWSGICADIDGDHLANCWGSTCFLN